MGGSGFKTIGIGRRHLPVVCLWFIMALGPPAAAGNPMDCVLLLHGLARTERSLSKLERHLTDEGFGVVNIGYPSREKTVQELSKEIIPAAIAHCGSGNTGKLHFVTHSLGGILVRHYLEHHEVPNLGRVVMLSPPNSGSQVVDNFRDTSIFKWIYGPAGAQLGTDPDSIPNTLGAPVYDLGIIAGDRTLNPIFSLMLPGKDDGKVSVESAKLQGMADFLVVHSTHTSIMDSETVLRQVTAFIKNGVFARD